MAGVIRDKYLKKVQPIQRWLPMINILESFYYFHLPFALPNAKNANGFGCRISPGVPGEDPGD